MAYYESDDVALCSNFNQVLRIDCSLSDSRYMFYQLCWLRERGAFAPLSRKTTGLQNLQMSKFGDLQVKCPAKLVQRARAESLYQIQQLVRDGKALINRLDDLVKSQFVEMFGELAPSVSLASICELFTDGDWIESKDQSIGGIRLLQTGNVGNGKFRNKGDKARYITGETFDRLQCKDVLAGDILISRLPDPVGRACAVPESLGRCITAVDCSILRLKPEWNVSFVVWFTRTADYENQIREYLTGTTRKRISRSNLGKIKIPAADSELQQQFADFVARVDKLGFGIWLACKSLHEPITHFYHQI